MKERNPQEQDRTNEQQERFQTEPKKNSGRFEKGSERAREAGRKGGRAGS